MKEVCEIKRKLTLGNLRKKCIEKVDIQEKSKSMDGYRLKGKRHQCKQKPSFSWAWEEEGF